MANYYNVTGWKHTGLNAFNRPYSREVLNKEWFKSAENYIQMKGIAVKRDDIMGLNYLDLQGSVKDMRGDQVSPPNSTGVHGPGGPWYSWEEVDYIRLTRTGYPGDEDYVDISGNMDDPWNAPRDGKLYIAYYFVTGLQPLARNVTRLYLALDEWTTLGGADELTIETGYKIRGPITDAEDAAGYNLASENIGLIEPLTTVAHEPDVTMGYTDEQLDILVSSIDLTQYSEGQEIDGFVAATASGQMVFPAIRPASASLIQYNAPGLAPRNIKLPGYGFFNPLNARVSHNLAILYSAGQLELQDSYTVPVRYINAQPSQGDAFFSELANVDEKWEPTIKKDIAGYPRKADYLYGQEVLYSKASGEMSAIPFYDLTDDTILVWANVGPSGTPFARFKTIRGHQYIYDKAIKGMTWAKKAVVLQGASGSMWAQVNNAFAQQTQERNERQNEFNNQIDTQTRVVQGTNLALQTVAATANAANRFTDPKNVASADARSRTIEALGTASQMAADLTQFGIDSYAEYKNRGFRAESLAQAQNQINAQMAQALYSAPYASFLPDINMSLLAENDFGLYIVNTGTKDRERLRNYFRRYGYSGQYKPLTWQEVNVKQKVNFIQCEGVTLRHQFHPMRLSDMCSRLLEGGVFLWHDRPDQSAFADNPDN